MAASKQIFVLLLVVSGCASNVDPDVKFFIANYSGQDKDWINKLSEERQVDMFFASHKTKPTSYFVDEWIIFERPDFVVPLRREISRRGSMVDKDAYLHVVDVLYEQKKLDDSQVRELDLNPLCATATSTVHICKSPQ